MKASDLGAVAEGMDLTSNVLWANDIVPQRNDRRLGSILGFTRH